MSICEKCYWYEDCKLNNKRKINMGCHYFYSVSCDENDLTDKFIEDEEMEYKIEFNKKHYWENESPISYDDYVSKIDIKRFIRNQK